MGLRRDVLDGGDVETGGLQRANRRLTAGAGALGEDLDPLEPVFHALFGGRVGGHLGGERGRLARTFEPGRTGRLPGDHVAVGIGEGDDRVVERRLDVRLPVGDVLFNPAAGAPFRRFFLSHLCLYLALAGYAEASGALAATSVGLRPLAANRQPATVA